MNRNKRKYKKDYLSTPLWAYALLLVMISVSIVFWGCGGCQFWSNMFYAIVGSFVVSLMIDLGNTAARNSADLRNFNFITKKFFEYASSISDEINLCVGFHFFYENNLYSSKELINHVLQPTHDYSTYMSEIDLMNSLFRTVSDLHVLGADLQRSLLTHCDNSQFSEEYSEKVDEVVAAAETFCRMYGRMGRLTGESVYVLPYGDLKTQLFKVLDSLSVFDSKIAEKINEKKESGEAGINHVVSIKYGTISQTINPEKYDIVLETKRKEIKSKGNRRY